LSPATSEPATAPRGARLAACPGARRQLLQAVAAVSVAWPFAAAALTGGDGPTEARPGTPEAAVGSLAVNGQLFSAVRVGPKQVLTAAHIVAGAAPAGVVLRTALGGGRAIAAVAVSVHPGYTASTTGRPPNDAAVQSDLAIVHLEAEPPAGMPIAVVYPGEIAGRMLELVSHGGSTTLQRTGENRVERVFANAQGRPGSYLFVVDDPATAPTTASTRSREAGLADGDSGSAAFVSDGRRWQLAGINTYRLQVRSATGTLAAAGGGVVLAPHARWIEEVVKAGPQPAPTPPPQPAAPAVPADSPAAAPALR
jgi:hypothetical protein